jgi:hypothetical protein
MTTPKTTKAFYVRFQVPNMRRKEASATIDRFMKDFIGFLEGRELGPVGDMSPSGQAVFLIIGINSRDEQVIVDVKEGDPGPVDMWLTERGVPHEVGLISDIEIGAGTKIRKETP